MIANLTTGKGFGGTVRYVLSKEGAVPLGGSFGPATQWSDLAEEARVLRSQMAHLKKPVLHVSLALPPGEQLDDATWREVARDYLEGMGMKNSPYVVARHTDTEHDHIHIVTMRWDVEHGRAVDLWKSKTRSAAVVQELERAHGLTRATRLPDQAHEMPHRAPKLREVKQAEREGHPVLPRQQLRQTVQHILEQERPRTLPRFIEKARDRGIEVQPNLQSTGRLAGLRYTDMETGASFKASELGKAYGVPGLARSGVSYEPTRDQQALQTPSSPKKSPTIDVDL